MSKKDFRINVKDYKIISQIGKGSYGVVYSVKNQTTGEILAAKVYLDNNNDDDDDDEEGSSKIQILNREIKVLKACQHPTVVRFQGFSKTDFNGLSHFTLFFEHCEKGSLRDLLDTVQKGTCDIVFTNTHRQIILIGIARGLMYLHQQRIIHRDMKPENILIDSNFHPHITDFGLSQKFEGYEPMMSRSCGCGTPIYMSPEVIKEENVYTSKADIYALGLIMYEVITDNKPFAGIKNTFQLYSAVSSGLRPEFNIPVKKSLKKLVEQCLKADPSERPTADEVFNALAYGVDPVLGGDDDDERLFYLDSVDIDEIQDYIDLIKDDDNDENDANSLKAIKDLNSKIDKMKAYVDDLQQENQKLKVSKNPEQKGEQENQRKIQENQRKIQENQRKIQENQRKNQEGKNASVESDDLRMKKLEREVDMMKKERNDIFDRFDKINLLMNKKFNEVNSRFTILMSCMTSVIIPNEMTQIPYASFMNCSNLEKVTFPQTLKIIGNSAFSGCTSLKELNFPESLTMIDKYAFAYCKSLKKLNIPSSVKTVGRSAFKHCVSLSKVKVSKSTKFEENVFRDCTSLKSDPSQKKSKKQKIII